MAFAAAGEFGDSEIFVSTGGGTNLTKARQGDAEPDWQPVHGYPRPKGAPRCTSHS